MTDKRLLDLAKALKERALDDHRKRKAESARIQADIARIDQQAHLVWASTNGFASARSVGADAAWRNWLATQRAALLQQAALARATEIDSRRRAKQAFGRNEALHELANQERHTIEQNKTLKRQAQLQDLAILRDAMALKE